MSERKDQKPTKRRPKMDLEEVLTRARAMNPDAVDPSWTADAFDDAEASADDLDLEGFIDRPTDPALADFLGGVQRHLDETVERRRLADIPAPPHTRARWRWMGLGMAAAVAMLVGGTWWVGARGMSNQVTATQAVYTATGTPKGLGRVPVEAASEVLSTGAAPESAPVEAVEVDVGAPTPEGAAPGGVGEGTDVATKVARSEEAPSRSDAPTSRKGPRLSLDELDARAQSAWADGQLREAERLFEAIIDRAPRSRRAELAYADLFSLAEQRGATGRLPGLWKAYLRRFPSGRYSDDTRARLCRRAPQAKSAACWSGYLRRHPDGAHVREARAVIGGADAP